jgi:hypothetical protein
MWIFKPGLIIPFVGKRRLPVNRDGSLVDTGELDVTDEKSVFYIEIWTFEWFGIGIPISTKAYVRDSKTGEPV